MKKPTKILALLLCLALAIPFFASCSGKKSNAATDAKKTSEETTAVATGGKTGGVTEEQATAAAPTESATEPKTEPVTEPASEPETTAAPTEPETEPATDPATDPVTEPATEPETAPVTVPATEPETTAAPTEPETEPATDPATEPVTEPTTEPEEQIVPAGFVPVLRFLVASDVHYTDSVGEQDRKLKKMLGDAYAYSDAKTDYTALDGVFIVGDISHRGTTTSLNRFFSDLYENTREGTNAQAVLGNHEFRATGQEASTVQNYLAASGYDAADRHLVISGYHFILISPDRWEDSDGFSDAKIAWLSNELAAAAADDPTGKKPIFVFQHYPPKDTVYGSEGEWGVTNLSPVFSLYPQAVDFAGHSHFPINDPRSVWQGEYTVFNTGSCREWGCDIAGVTARTVFPLDDQGAWSFTELPGNLFDPGKYYIVEVDSLDRILVRAFDVGTGVEVIEPIFLESVGDPAQFTYTDARAEDETLPRFADGAAVSVVYSTANETLLRFPRATAGGYVQHYRCEILLDGTVVDSVIRLDDGFLFPAPETLKIPLGSLTPGTLYTLRIVPVSAWANEGEPLLCELTIGLDEPSTPAEALVFSAVFGEGGTATDAASGEPLSAVGAPATVYNAESDSYYAVLDGASAFEFYGMEDLYPVLTDSFTFEVLLTMDGKPTSGYVAPCSNQDDGGFGLEYGSDGVMRMWVHVGKYLSAEVALSTSVRAHLVATFDGSDLILYLNGEEVARTAASGTVTTPRVHFLSIGGDSQPDGSGFLAACTVEKVNIYRSALSAEQVAGLTSPAE